MLNSIGLYSYLSALVFFFALSALLIFSARRNQTHISLKIAAVCSTLWSATVTLFYLRYLSAPILLPLTEIIRDFAWCFFLLKLAKPGQLNSEGGVIFKLTNSKKGITAVAALIAFSILGPGHLLPTQLSILTLNHDLPLIAWISISIIGLTLVEQTYRNLDNQQRWALKHLCLGAGCIFAFDFFMYADALLFRKLDQQLWVARGVVNAIAVPLITVSITRMSGWDKSIQVSRKVVFHTAALTGAGIYLVLMSAAGYFIRYYGGSWGGVLQIVFLCGAGALLFTLLFSDRIRANIRVILSKHFFSYKYDYREEWQRFTHSLSDTSHEAPERICLALSALVNSDGASIWSKSEDDTFKCIASINTPITKSTGTEFNSLIGFLARTGWVVDIKEYNETPGLYDNLYLPESITQNPRAWLIVPLLFDTTPSGFVIINYSDLKASINWEDRDLLKIAGKQAASLLEQHQANLALLQARQFEAFNRLSAYIVHDLKNILAQQSLIVANAEKHKHKPEFVDDVILTVRNSVDRMTRLMEQMRNGMRGSSPETISLQPFLENICAKYNRLRPLPLLSANVNESCIIVADSDQLANVFGHLIQNAQEATPDSGSISVTLETDENRANIIITDTGSGMSEEFIASRLFKPFDSTKGLTGMGIGVFESREVVRTLGGEISVISQPGAGSSFTVTLPLAEQPS